MGLTRLDSKIADYYAKWLLDPIRLGESGTFFWWPGSGMTTIISDILGNSTILKKYLGSLTKSMKIISLFGHIAFKKTLEEMLSSHNIKTEEALIDQINGLLKSGTEVTIVLGRIDDYPLKEKTRIIKYFTRLVLLNHRRVHLIFNTVDKIWFEKYLSKNSESIVIANTIKIMPIISGKLLESYISERAKKYQFELNDDSMNDIVETYGGILQLTKEYLRSAGNPTNINVKLRLHWEILPSLYKDSIKKELQGESSIPENVTQDLTEFGINNLSLFEKHSHIIDVNPEAKLLISCTTGEKNLWEYLNHHPRELISKDQVTELLRPDNELDISLWAVDKAVSRFRKKLFKNGIDPEILKTIKGKGYIWQH